MIFVMFDTVPTISHDFGRDYPTDTCEYGLRYINDPTFFASVIGNLQHINTIHIVQHRKDKLLRKPVRRMNFDQDPFSWVQEYSSNEVDSTFIVTAIQDEFLDALPSREEIERALRHLYFGKPRLVYSSHKKGLRKISPEVDKERREVTLDNRDFISCEKEVYEFLQQVY